MDYLPSFAVDFLPIKRESENKSDAFCIVISLQGFFDAYSIANPNITLPQNVSPVKMSNLQRFIL